MKLLVQDTSGEYYYGFVVECDNFEMHDNNPKFDGVVIKYIGMTSIVDVTDELSLMEMDGGDDIDCGLLSILEGKTIWSRKERCVDCRNDDFGNCLVEHRKNIINIIHDSEGRIIECSNYLQV